MGLLDNVKALYRGAAPTVSTTLYTVPVGKQTVVTSLAVTNAGVQSRTLTILMNGTELFKDSTFPANSTDFAPGFRIKLTAGQTIVAVGSSAELKIHLDGIEENV